MQTNARLSPYTRGIIYGMSLMGAKLAHIASTLRKADGTPPRQTKQKKKQTKNVKKAYNNKEKRKKKEETQKKQKEKKKTQCRLGLSQCLAVKSLRN